MIRTHSGEETKAVGKALAQHLKGGEFVVLIGDLGAGKTTFVQGLVEALGSKARVKSPTFTVMNEYPIDPPRGKITRVVHVDFYRFIEEGELKALTLEDERRPDTIILAEWPDRFSQDLFPPDFTVHFTHVDEDVRTISFTPEIATS